MNFVMAGLSNFWTMLLQDSLIVIPCYNLWEIRLNLLRSDQSNILMLPKGTDNIDPKNILAMMLSEKNTDICHRQVEIYHISEIQMEIPKSTM